MYTYTQIGVSASILIVCSASKETPNRALPGAADVFPALYYAVK